MVFFHLGIFVILIGSFLLARDRFTWVLEVAPILIVVSICLAFSAFYELIEWWTSVSRGASAEAFPGTQGDEWDAQWDMFMCLIGAVTSMLTMKGLHDRSLARLTETV